MCLQLDGALQQLDQYTHLAFTSKNGILAVLERLAVLQGGEHTMLLTIASLVCFRLHMQNIRCPCRLMGCLPSCCRGHVMTIQRTLYTAECNVQVVIVAVGPVQVQRRISPDVHCHSSVVL